VVGGSLAETITIAHQDAHVDVLATAEELGWCLE